MSHPIFVSVIMSVYNTKEEYLRAAIESILNQTHKNFEFIIINDYSDLATANVLHSYTDHRIKLIENTENLGLTKSLNIALEAATGKYIFRMDADDVSLPDRFKEQIKYMECHPDISVVGALTKDIGNSRSYSKHWTNNPDLLKIRLLFYNAGIAHPTACFRKDFLDKYKIKYNEQLKKTQDYDMWVQIMQYGLIGIVPIVLLEYRVHDQQISVANRSEQLQCEYRIKEQQLKRFRTLFTEQEKNILYHLFRGDEIESANAAGSFLRKLEHANREEDIYQKNLFRRETVCIWIIAAIKRLIHFKKADMLLQSFSARILLPVNLLHFLNYCVFEDYHFIKLNIWGR